MYIKCEDTKEECYTYKEYLQSRHWKAVKEKYQRSKLQKCCYVCGKTENLDLHHKTYKRLGKEHLTDLMLLCRDHHNELHTMKDKLALGGVKKSIRTVGKRVKRKYNK